MVDYQKICEDLYIFPEDAGRRHPRPYDRDRIEKLLLIFLVSLVVMAAFILLLYIYFRIFIAPHMLDFSGLFDRLFSSLRLHGIK